VVVASLLAILVASCDTATTPTPSTSGQATRSTAQPTGPPFVPNVDFAWTLRTSSGYMVHSYLQAAPIFHVSDAPTLPGALPAQELAGQCGVNSQTDGVMPVEATLTNETPDFSVDAQNDLELPENVDPSNPVPLSLKVATSTGCLTVAQVSADNDSPMWTLNCGQLSPNASCTITAFIVARSYFTPNSPSGDPFVREGIQFTIFQDVELGYLTQLQGEGPDVSGMNTNEPIIDLGGCGGGNCLNPAIH